MLAFLRHLGYRNCIGIDNHRASVEVAHKMGIDAAVFVEDAFSYLRSNPSGFDVIIIKDALYYFSWENALLLLQLSRNALKAEGRLIVEVFNGALLTAFFTLSKDSRIRLALTENSLSDLLTEAGFRIRAMFGQRVRRHTWRGVLYRSVQFLSRQATRLLYVAERGFDSNNPKILTKSIIAVADAQ